MAFHLQNPLPEASPAFPHGSQPWPGCKGLSGLRLGALTAALDSHAD